MITHEEIKRRYPLHWLVWNNYYKELREVLQRNEVGEKYHILNENDLEMKDPRGRTPLMLAVTLGYVESVRVLLEADTNVNCECDGWTAVQEATSTGDPELLALVLEQRDRQRQCARASGVPALLKKLADAPDFYVEMKWEFTSWVPLVSRMCPSDTYRIYKQGSNVRMDTTLLGFDQNKWHRGNKSYIFSAEEDGATMMELDHDVQEVWIEKMNSEEEAAVVTLGGRVPSEEALSQRLTAPICTTYLDTEKISFERSKSGVWGWRSDKNDSVCGYECKVFGASDVELVSKTRTEHLDSIRRRNSQPNPLRDLLALQIDNQEFESVTNPSKIAPEEYFSGEELGNRDIGRPKKMTTKIQKFKASLWLCENYPLELQEQIVPILDLMASMSSPHFIKLKHFIQMQLPSGFPIKIGFREALTPINAYLLWKAKNELKTTDLCKYVWCKSCKIMARKSENSVVFYIKSEGDIIRLSKSMKEKGNLAEIPLFHVLNARITFCNIFATETPVKYVQCISEGDRMTCVIDEECFGIPPGYRDIATAHLDRRQLMTEDEDELLQFAIQQSLLETGTEHDQVDIWEALRAERSSRPDTPSGSQNDEEQELQRKQKRSQSVAFVDNKLLNPKVDIAPRRSFTPNQAIEASLVSAAMELRQEQAQLNEALRLSLIEN